MYAKNTIEVLGPDPEPADEVIWDHIDTHFGSSWHMSCTVKMMGKGPEDAFIDSNFKIFGLRVLRVAVISGAPFVPKYRNYSSPGTLANNFQQSCADHSIRSGGGAPRREIGK